MKRKGPARRRDERRRDRERRDEHAFLFGPDERCHRKLGLISGFERLAAGARPPTRTGISRAGESALVQTLIWTSNMSGGGSQGG